MLQMSVEQLMSENERMREENNHLMSENLLQKVQIANLAQVNVFASNIVRLTDTSGNLRGSHNNISLIHRTISTFVTNARSIILSVTNVAFNASTRIRELIIKVCNFIWDHLGEIGIGAVIIPAITICVGISLLSIGILTGHLEAVPLVGQELIDYQNMMNNFLVI
jgi:hypothetical protein